MREQLLAIRDRIYDIDNDAVARIDILLDHVALIERLVEVLEKEDDRVCEGDAALLSWVLTGEGCPYAIGANE